MTSEEYEQPTPSNEGVELVLLGIDKKWVRSKNGEWNDKDKISADAIPPTNLESTSKQSKWWKFWKS